MDIMKILDFALLLLVRKRFLIKLGIRRDYRLSLKFVITEIKLNLNLFFEFLTFGIELLVSYLRRLFRLQNVVVSFASLGISQHGQCLGQLKKKKKMMSHDNQTFYNFLMI